jgi:hypothetical protein
MNTPTGGGLGKLHVPSSKFQKKSQLKISKLAKPGPGTGGHDPNHIGPWTLEFGAFLELAFWCLELC